jgi:hypothetical protein
MFRVNCFPISFEKFIFSALQQWYSLAFSITCLQWKKQEQCVQTHFDTSSTISCATLCSHFFPRHAVAQFNPLYQLHPCAYQYSCFKLFSPICLTVTTTLKCRYNQCSLLANPFYHHSSVTFHCYMFYWFQFCSFTILSKFLSSELQRHSYSLICQEVTKALNYSTVQ